MPRFVSFTSFSFPSLGVLSGDPERHRTEDERLTGFSINCAGRTPAATVKHIAPIVEASEAGFSGSTDSISFFSIISLIACFSSKACLKSSSLSPLFP
jgi:hypothetical protein